MESFSYETVDRLESFATFMENFVGRIMDVRSATNRSASEQLAAWKLVETELNHRVMEQRVAVEEAGDTSPETSKTRFYDVLQDHLNELDRLLKRLITLNTEAETIHQRLLATEQNLESYHDSDYVNGIHNLRRYAEAMRNYLEVMQQRY